MWEREGVWHGLVKGTEVTEVTRPSREECLRALRRAAGPDAPLTVEMLPALAGVAEAAAIMGWDKRRVITYLNRGSFPAPFARLASGRVWLREDVEDFAAAWRARRATRKAT